MCDGRQRGVYLFVVRDRCWSHRNHIAKVLGCVSVAVRKETSDDIGDGKLLFGKGFTLR